VDYSPICGQNRRRDCCFFTKWPHEHFTAVQETAWTFESQMFIAVFTTASVGRVKLDIDGFLSTSFPIHYSSTILQQDVTESEIVSKAPKLTTKWRKQILLFASRSKTSLNTYSVLASLNWMQFWRLPLCKALCLAQWKVQAHLFNPFMKN